MSHTERNFNTKQEIEERVIELQDELEFLSRINTGCELCVSRMNYTGGCLKAGGEVPPEDVQQSGCPEWYWDGIPF